MSSRSSSKTKLSSDDSQRKSGDLLAIIELYIQKITDQRTLKADFPRRLLAELYITRTLMFAAFTLGLRLGSLRIVFTTIRLILLNIFLPVATYIVLPLLGMGLTVLYNKERINHDEAIFSLTVWSMLCGIFSSTHNIHYQMGARGPPIYFMPVLVGITVYFIGNRFDNDRKNFVLVAVGSSTTVSLTMLLITGELNYCSLIAVAMASINAALGLQLMVFDLMEEGKSTNAITPNVFGVIFGLYNALVFTHTFGEYVEDPTTNNVANSVPLVSAFSV